MACMHRLSAFMSPIAMVSSNGPAGHGPVGGMSAVRPSRLEACLILIMVYFRTVDSSAGEERAMPITQAHICRALARHISDYFEEARSTLPASDAHRDYDIFRTAALAFNECMSSKS